MTRTTRRLYSSLMKAAGWHARGCDRPDLDELSDREILRMTDMAVRLRRSADQLAATTKAGAAVFLLCLLVAIPAAAVSPSSWRSLDASETSATMKWNGGGGSLQVWGAFTGPPTVTIEWQSFNSAPWVALNSADCTFTAPGFCSFSIGNGSLRLVVTGGTGADIVSAYVGQPNQASAGTAGAPGGGGGAGLLSITEATPDTIYEPLAPGGFLRLRKSSGAAASDVTLANSSDDLLIDAQQGDAKVYNATGLVFETANGATRQQIILPNDVRIRGDDGGPTASQFGKGDTTGFSATTTGIHGVIAAANIFSGSASGLQIADGLRFEYPQSTGAPTVTESAAYWDSDGKELCIYDSSRWQCVGQIHGELHGTTGTISLSVENTYTQWTDATAGPSVGVVASGTTDDLVVPYAGDYEITLHTSFSGPTNDTITCNVHENGSPGAAIFTRKMGTGGDVGAASTGGYLTLAASDVLEVFCKNDPGDGTGTITITRFALMARRL